MAAAKEEMLSGFGQWCADLPLAASFELSENSRQGFARKKAALHLGQWVSKSTTELGIERGLLGNCIGSRIQSWNRYAYVLNNPLSNIDPLGLDCAYDNGDGRFNVQPGDCNSLTDDGYYFDGTVDPSSLQYNVNGGLLGNVDGTTQCSGDCQTNSVNVTGQQGTLWQLLTTTVPYYDPNDVPLSPSGQAAALAIHNALANVPNVCSIGAQAEASATVFGVTASASASGSFSDNGAPGQLSAQLPFGQPHSIGSVQSQAQGTPLIPDAVPSPVNAQVQGGYVLSVNAGKTIGGNHLSLSLTAYANLGGRCP